MPMYFPDLKSVQSCVNAMRHNEGDKRYNGIYPETEEQLQQARLELARYFRIVWHDEIQAMEVELAVTEENYHEKMGDAIMLQFMSRRRGADDFPLSDPPDKFIDHYPRKDEGE